MENSLTYAQPTVGTKGVKDSSVLLQQCNPHCFSKGEVGIAGFVEIRFVLKARKCYTLSLAK